MCQNIVIRHLVFIYCHYILFCINKRNVRHQDKIALFICTISQLDEWNKRSPIWNNNSLFTFNLRDVGNSLKIFFR